MTFPRSKERGLIEAHAQEDDNGPSAFFPRSKERGLIEAIPVMALDDHLLSLSAFERTRPH